MNKLKSQRKKGNKYVCKKEVVTPRFSIKLWGDRSTYQLRSLVLRSHEREEVPSTTLRPEGTPFLTWCQGIGRTS